MKLWLDSSKNRASSCGYTVRWLKGLIWSWIERGSGEIRNLGIMRV